MKISKNLKRLRSDKGITQEQLAEMLFISRQSVSSWENDRTQPDIQMLGKLSEIFGVSIEELIYGKKHNITLETQKPNYNSTLMIVFSILGALLAGTGIVLIFVTFWQKLPMLFKAVLSFLPLLAGQGAGIFVLSKKKDKIHWREGAGILWAAGIAATLAMIYNIFDLDIYWHTLLIFVSVCIIPVILLLGAVSPVAAYYSCTIIWFLSGIDADNPYNIVLITAVLISAGCIFTSKLTTKENKSIRSLYSHWVSIAAVIVFIFCLGAAVDGGLVAFIICAGAAGLCLLLISLTEPDIIMPYRIPGLLLTSLFLFGCGALYYGNTKCTTANIVFTAATLITVAVTLAAVLFTRKKAKDKFLLLYIAVGIITLSAFSVISYFMPEFPSKSVNDEIFITALKIIAIIANILLIISGGKEKKLLSINTGFVSVSALSFLFVYQSDFSMIVNGLLLLVSGAVLLTINFRLSRHNEKKPASANSEEVDDNE